LLMCLFIEKDYIINTHKYYKMNIISISQKMAKSNCRKTITKKLLNNDIMLSAQCHVTDCILQYCKLAIYLFKRQNFELVPVRRSDSNSTFRYLVYCIFF